MDVMPAATSAADSDHSRGDDLAGRRRGPQQRARSPRPTRTRSRVRRLLDPVDAPAHGVDDPPSAEGGAERQRERARDGRPTVRRAVDLAARQQRGDHSDRLLRVVRSWLNARIAEVTHWAPVDQAQIRIVARRASRRSARITITAATPPSSGEIATKRRGCPRLRPGAARRSLPENGVGAALGLRGADQPADQRVSRGGRQAERQVIRFQVTALARPAPITAMACAGETVTMPPMVSATAAPTNSGPSRLKTVASTIAASAARRGWRQGPRSRWPHREVRWSPRRRTRASPRASPGSIVRLCWPDRTRSGEAAAGRGGTTLDGGWPLLLTSTSQSP